MGRFAQADTINYKSAVRVAVRAVAAKFVREMGLDNWAMAFNRVFQDGITFEIGPCDPCDGAGGYTHSSTHIEFDNQNPFFDPTYQDEKTYNRTPALSASLNIHNVIHEIGHAFANIWSEKGLTTGSYSKTMPKDFYSDNGFGVAPQYGLLLWRMHPIRAGENSVTIHHEVFADMFLGWTYSNSGLSSERRKELNINMASWLSSLP